MGATHSRSRTAVPSRPAARRQSRSTHPASPARPRRGAANVNGEETSRAEHALLEQYAGTRDPALRQQIVAAFAPLVGRIAGDFTKTGISIDELKQVGYLGILNALEMFDPARGARFASYAGHFIRGEIQHYLRDSHDTIRRPRWLKRINAQLEAAVARHVDQHGRHPTFQELAAAMNITEEGLSELLRTREALRTLSLGDDDSAEIDVDRQRIRHQTFVSFQLPIEDRIVLYQALEHLTELQRRVLYYLFFKDLTQLEAARRIGVSQKHISRILAKSLSRLRTVLSRSLF